MNDNSKNKSYVTISVDDGAPGDLQAADYFTELNLKATFYIPAMNSENELLNEDGVKQIAKNFEIGGHTLNHVPLAGLSKQKAKDEIVSGKKWLEDVIGREVVSFCYPRGKFTSETVNLVKEAGFFGARTCLFNHLHWPQNPFLWGVSTHAYSHSMGIQLRHALLEKNFTGIQNYLTKFKRSVDWEKHFACALDSVEKSGGIAHLYFHSWEIEQYNQWDKLKRVLKNIQQRQNMVSVTNGELFQMLQKHKLKPTAV